MFRVTQSSACILCSINCGLELEVDEQHILAVRGDRDHPASRGYLCEKPRRLDLYQNSEARLTAPLRRRPDGSFEELGRREPHLGERGLNLEHHADALGSREHGARKPREQHHRHRGRQPEKPADANKEGDLDDGYEGECQEEPKEHGVDEGSTGARLGRVVPVVPSRGPFLRRRATRNQ